MKVGLELHEEFFIVISFTRDYFHSVAGSDYRAWHHTTQTPLQGRLRLNKKPLLLPLI
jgi:hypothetical protein